MNNSSTNKQKFYINVALAVPLFQTYTYEVSEPFIDSCQIGVRVMVPFGHQTLSGYCLETTTPTKTDKIKCILDVLDDTPLFYPDMVQLFNWMAKYYFFPIGNVVKSCLPDGLSVITSNTATITLSGQKILLDTSINPIEQKVLEFINKSPQPIKNIRKHFKNQVPISCIRRLERQAYIKIEKKEFRGSASLKSIKYVRHVIKQSPELTKRQVQLMTLIEQAGEMSIENIRKLGFSSQIVQTLNQKGCLEYIEKEFYRDPFGETIAPDTYLPMPTNDQAQVIGTLEKSIGNEFLVYLLYGVTGSGKTEVYMRATNIALSKNRTALILVPEIALITQVERQFRARFGDCVAVLHSSLSNGERFDQWMRIVRKQATIVIGARSAVFAPLENIGVIIVDEEHDPSYKQSTQFRYHGRDVAVMRGKMADSVVILGSATPSVQNYHHGVQKKYQILQLPRRIQNRPMPHIHVVDLKQNQGVKGVRRFITPQLESALKGTFERKQQSLLFLNRRGFATYPVCAQCGESLMCKNCDIAMIFHKNIRAYKCHYCGFTRAHNTKCPNCASPNIKQLGYGTQRLEQDVKALFPEARVARMDQDTTRKKGATIQILKQLRDHKIDILVGTQMIVKGHDFPNITMVGIICADLSLNFPDFRSGELTYQLLAQVSGRAGRGENPGRVILQTFNPNHFIIQTAKKQNYQEFFEYEIQFRKNLNYPPYARLIQLTIAGKDESATATYARNLGQYCQHIKASGKAFTHTIEILGPVLAPVSRIANRYRWQILLKSLYLKSLHQFYQYVKQAEDKHLKNKDVQCYVDVDPVVMS
ncbi:primosome assembly protein PriA [Candidatus Magnetomorum sp. HK-1]|nr:primosome assembly protein PriA [Candidatus Magnetomorum sp. HK-1]